MRIPIIASAILRYPHSPSINHYLFFPLLNLPHAKTKTGCDLRRKLRHMCTKVHLSSKANGCNSKNGFAIYRSASPFQIHCKRKMLRHIKKTVHFIHALCSRSKFASKLLNFLVKSFPQIFPDLGIKNRGCYSPVLTFILESTE